MPVVFNNKKRCLGLRFKDEQLTVGAPEGYAQQFETPMKENTG